jgi:hypothetical protein
MAHAILETEAIADWESFHTVCKAAFGFPDFYGRNMDAWIDCLTDMDDGGDGMSRFVLADAEMLTIEVRDADDFAERMPEQSQALISCTAFVNARYVADGKSPKLLLVLVGKPHGA